MKITSPRDDCEAMRLFGRVNGANGNRTQPLFFQIKVQEYKEVPIQ